LVSSEWSELCKRYKRIGKIGKRKRKNKKKYNRPRGPNRPNPAFGPRPSIAPSRKGYAAHSLRPQTSGARMSGSPLTSGRSPAPARELPEPSIPSRPQPYPLLHGIGLYKTPFTTTSSLFFSPPKHLQAAEISHRSPLNPPPSPYKSDDVRYLRRLLLPSPSSSLYDASADAFLLLVFTGNRCRHPHPECTDTTPTSSRTLLPLLDKIKDGVHTEEIPSSSCTPSSTSPSPETPRASPESNLWPLPADDSSPEP
jgi:hypothetical protein